MGAIRTPKILLVWAAAVVTVSCAPRPGMPDTGAIATRIREASEACGRGDPSAAYYFALAERELHRAQILERVRDVQGAESWARRASADADLARMLAVEVALREAARRTERDAEVLFRKLEGRR